MRISDWSSDVCSSDLLGDRRGPARRARKVASPASRARTAESGIFPPWPAMLLRAGPKSIFFWVEAFGAPGGKQNRGMARKAAVRPSAATEGRERPQKTLGRRPPHPTLSPPAERDRKSVV